MFVWVRCVGWVCECVLEECVSVFVWVWCDCAHGLSGGEIFLGSRNINMDLENRSMDINKYSRI